MIDRTAPRISACPVCRKADPLASGEGAVCSRCSADLAEYERINRCAGRLRRDALLALRLGDYGESLILSTQAWSLVKHPAILPIACLAAAAGGDSSALAAWRAAKAGT